MNAIYRARSAGFVFVMILLLLDHVYVSFTQSFIMSRSGYILAITIGVYFIFEFYFKRMKKSKSFQR